MKLHLFNPENDLALGLGCRHYTPPPHAAAIHRAGALLPMWWANEDDLVLAPAELNEEADMLAGQFGLHGRIADTADVTEVEPWGWSLDAKRQFLRAGVKESVLPTDEAIERIRQLSHRRSSIAIIEGLTGDYPVAVETTEPDVVVEMERSHPGCFIKSPWSGSGRGVFCARSLEADALRRRAEGLIHRQGSVMVERGLDKQTDFASLFHSDGQKVEFKGLSVFSTEARGMYSGNIVAPQEYLWDKIGQEIDIRTLKSVIRQQEDILSDLIGNAYSGWMGIDMMTYRDRGGIRLMPCIELNLRRTMGVVAMQIASRLNVTTPRFLAWEHQPGGNSTPASPSGESQILLPPAAGFTLRLT
ncbi:hypothetical protein [uncultured Duncaniella sp.]|uniref:hypothetical protein n=1 Tax=uncultured Duncaniella sp. TaxID=2768039 RepID=UPI0026143388|nr:hypothetical protein [uncultured Duncaniella sp.]